MANWLRERGLTWKRIAHVLGYSGRDSGADARKVGYVSARSAREMARRYTERAGKPWPVPVRDALQHGYR